MALDEERLDALRTLLAERKEVRWAYLFGSAARGEPHRDVDVAVMFDEELELDLTIWGSLVASLAEGAGCEVDLVDLRRAPLALAGPMLEDRIVLVDHDRAARIDWETSTTSMWIDFRPRLEQFWETRREAMRLRTEQAG